MQLPNMELHRYRSVSHIIAFCCLARLHGLLRYEQNIDIAPRKARQLSRQSCMLESFGY